MKYRLRWKRSALDELTEMWTNAKSADRSAITAGVNAIERELAALAEKAGESRSGAERILFHAPVAVLFETSEDDLEVVVLQVWRY
ncbi:MAG TPA: hypothetical protein VFI31_23520 [Pirellulales bacterium]|nr:hypothetical protein [Pirellulales bacterium]